MPKYKKGFNWSSYKLKTTLYYYSKICDYKCLLLIINEILLLLYHCLNQYLEINGININNNNYLLNIISMIKLFKMFNAKINWKIYDLSHFLYNLVLIQDINDMLNAIFDTNQSIGYLLLHSNVFKFTEYYTITTNKYYWIYLFYKGIDPIGIYHNKCKSLD